MEGFEVRPHIETAQPFIGRADWRDVEKQLVAEMEHQFGTDFKTSRWRGENTTPVVYQSLFPANAPLGFRVDHRAWKKQNVHYRLLSAYGDSQKRLGIVRFQGRRNQAYDTSLTFNPSLKNGEELLEDLKEWSAGVIGVPRESWWRNFDGTDVRVKRGRSQTSRVDVAPSRGLVVDEPNSNNPGAPAGYRSVESSGYSYNVTRSYTAKFKYPVFLNFRVTERGFKTPRAHYRQARLHGRHGKAAVDVVRFSGRSEGGSWVPVTPKTLKTQDENAVTAEVFRYYNVAAPGVR